MPENAPLHSAASPRRGPLAGLKVIEFGGIGPAPYGAMLLADLGADVLRIDRIADSGLGLNKPARFDLLARSRASLKVDLKHKDGLALVRDLIGAADALIEGFRPGTMERLGLGPDEVLALRPALVYGRVTGFGREGPLAMSAGHDLNFIALTGALDATGRAGAPPTPPLNLVGDFGGGGLLLAFGMACALYEARASGRGQVVDAAMIDGAASLMTSFFGLAAAGLHGPERGTNLLDSGAPHYDVYRCADGGYVAVAPIEAKFRALMLATLGLPAEAADGFEDPAAWPRLRAMLAARFATRPRDAWAALFEGSDACVTPVLALGEAAEHPHHRARGTFVRVDGIAQPAPAPRFSRTPADPPTPPRPPGAVDAATLARWGLDAARLAGLVRSGALGAPGPAP